MKSVIVASFILFSSAQALATNCNVSVAGEQAAVNFDINNPYIQLTDSDGTYETKTCSQSLTVSQQDVADARKAVADIDQRLKNPDLTEEEKTVLTQIRYRLANISANDKYFYCSYEDSYYGITWGAQIKSFDVYVEEGIAVSFPLSNCK